MQACGPVGLLERSLIDVGGVTFITLAAFFTLLSLNLGISL